MSSLGANIVRRIIKAATYSYRKKCYAAPSYCLPRNQRFEDHEKQLRKITPYCGYTSPRDKYLSPAYAAKMLGKK